MPEAIEALYDLYKAGGLDDLEADDQAGQTEAVAEARAGRPQKFPAVDGAVAVVPIEGILWGRKYAQIRADFDAALASEAVGGIVLNIDSPGGLAYGTHELARHIRDSRGTKPIVAVANPLAASAAYYLGSQADRFAVTPSGEAGSIGVISVHFDHSKMLEDFGVKATIIKAGRFKGEGNPFEPLTDEAREYEQSRIDDFYRLFVDDVAAGRSVDRKTVLEDFGEGRVFGARQAVSSGMADRVAGFDTVVREMLETGRNRKARRARAATARRRHELAVRRAST